MRKVVSWSRLAGVGGKWKAGRKGNHPEEGIQGLKPDLLLDFGCRRALPYPVDLGIPIIHVSCWRLFMPVS